MNDTPSPAEDGAIAEVEEQAVPGEMKDPTAAPEEQPAALPSN